MDRREIISKIMQKKELSQLPKKDVEKALNLFDKGDYSDEEKVKKTRWFLKKNYSGFTSTKLLSLKEKEPGWILRKHLSTRERIPHYKKLYSKLKKNYSDVTVFDLGAGVNGFSYSFFKGEVKYLGIEAVGQLVGLMNMYFKKQKLDAEAIHLSLFELEKLEKLIKKEKGKKIVFLFKTIDSLESLQRDYSKKLLKELVPLVDKVVISFATESMIKRQRIWVKRTWLLKFIEENFKLIEDFEMGPERFLVISKK